MSYFRILTTTTTTAMRTRRQTVTKTIGRAPEAKRHVQFFIILNAHDNRAVYNSVKEATNVSIIITHTCTLYRPTPKTVQKFFLSEIRKISINCYHFW